MVADEMSTVHKAVKIVVACGVAVCGVAVDESRDPRDHHDATFQFLFSSFQVSFPFGYIVNQRATSEVQSKSLPHEHLLLRYELKDTERAGDWDACRRKYSYARNNLCNASNGIV